MNYALTTKINNDKKRFTHGWKSLQFEIPATCNIKKKVFFYVGHSLTKYVKRFIVSFIRQHQMLAAIGARNVSRAWNNITSSTMYDTY